MSELKQQFIQKIKHDQNKYSGDSCCATSKDKEKTFSQFGQQSNNFVSISIYQKIAHECNFVDTSHKNIQMPEFKRSQTDFMVILDCVNIHPGYRNEYLLVLLVNFQQENNALKLVGLCEQQKSNSTNCQYNYFREPYSSYSYASCPTYKQDEAYVLRLSYQNYLKQNSFDEFQSIERNMWKKTLTDVSEIISTSEYSKQEKKQIFDESLMDFEKKIQSMLLTDKKYQQHLISKQAIVLARQYENRYFVSMDLIHDIEADLKDIRQQALKSGNFMVPKSGTYREDIRIVSVEDIARERIYFSIEKEKFFENTVPEEIECINQFWGFNQLTIHAEKDSWDSDQAPWTFYMTMSGIEPSLGVQILEYIDHDYFESGRINYLLYRAGACHVGKYPKLALTKLKNADQLYVYSSGSGDCPAGCIDKFFTSYQSSPYEGEAIPITDIKIPNCNHDYDVFEDYFSY